jgi:hypothetical protein
MTVPVIITRKVKWGGVEYEKTETLAPGGEGNLSVTVPANSTDKHYALAVDQSELQAVFLSSDKAVTIKTNSDSAPGDTIVLAAGQAIVWSAADAAAKAELVCPFSVDVTSVYITAEAAANVEIRSGMEGAL